MVTTMGYFLFEDWGTCSTFVKVLRGGWRMQDRLWVSWRVDWSFVILTMFSCSRWRLNFDSLPLSLVEVAKYLLDTLHPTPAVCGFPHKESLDFIRRYESLSFDRGMVRLLQSAFFIWDSVVSEHFICLSHASMLDQSVSWERIMQILSLRFGQLCWQKSLVQAVGTWVILYQICRCMLELELCKDQLFRVNGQKRDTNSVWCRLYLRSRR